MKDQGDWAFCTGINRMVFHRYAAPAVARSSTGHDDGTVRCALGTHADLVAAGAGLPRISGALPIPAAARPARGGHLLPGPGRCAPCVSSPRRRRWTACSATGAATTSTAVRPEVLLAIGHGRAGPGRVSRRIGLSPACAARLRNDDPCPAPAHRRHWWPPEPRSWEVRPIARRA